MAISLLLCFALIAPAHAGSTLQGGTDSTMLQGGTGSTKLEVGTESTTLQGGTEGALIQGRAEREGGPITILFVVDASLSMKDNLEHGVQKMDSAKQVLQQAMSRIPTECNLGLRVFGQFATLGLECQATALLVPPGQGNRRSIIEKIRGIRPTGMTPLTYALYQAAENDLARVQGKKTIILITDGEDTCGQDPCAYIRTLNSRGINLKVDIVGLAMKKGQKQLDCIASSSGGKYYDAHTAAQLIDSISNSVSKAISGTVILPGNKQDSGKILHPEYNDIVPIEPEGKEAAPDDGKNRIERPVGPKGGK